MTYELNRVIDPKYIRRCHKRLKELGAPLEHWHCECVIDGESDDFICELCGCQKVRYIHVMVHPEYDGAIHVGCICAGIMEGDLIAARARDDAAKRKSQRRANFRKKKWAGSDGRSWITRYKNRHVVIERDSFRGRDFFKISIDSEKYQWRNNQRVKTLEDAKLYVFELIDWEETECRKK